MCLHAKAEKLYQDKGINLNHLYLVSTNIKKNQNKKPQTIDQVLEIGNPVHQQRMNLCLYYYKY